MDILRQQAYLMDKELQWWHLAEEREHLDFLTSLVGMATGSRSRSHVGAEPDAGGSDKKPFPSVIQGESPTRAELCGASLETPIPCL